MLPVIVAYRACVVIIASSRVHGLRVDRFKGLVIVRGCMVQGVGWRVVGQVWWVGGGWLVEGGGSSAEG